VLKGELEMPYRLFRPETTGKLPLVVYLHGGGGLGNDNLKQLQFGNIFGTRLWLLPENQKRFPCYVVAPQSDSGWSDTTDGIRRRQGCRECSPD
jgi:predicted peptidase